MVKLAPAWLVFGLADKGASSSLPLSFSLVFSVSSNATSLASICSVFYHSPPSPLSSLSPRISAPLFPSASLVADPRILELPQWQRVAASACRLFRGGFQAARGTAKNDVDSYTYTGNVNEAVSLLAVTEESCSQDGDEIRRGTAQWMRIH